MQTTSIRLRARAAVLAGVALAACSSDRIENLNGPVLQQYTNINDRLTVQSLASGLLDGDRLNYTNNLLPFFSIIGRDLYRIDGSEPRWSTVLLNRNTPGNSNFIGGGLWVTPYNTVRAANLFVRGANATTILSAQEKSATVGFAQTMKALQYIQLIRSRDTVGIPIQVVEDSTAPIRCKPAVLAYISALLDSGSTALTAAGTTPFPFTLPAGWAGFNTSNAATGTDFLQFNRGLKAVVEMYRGFIPLQAANDPQAAPDVARLTAALANFDSSFYNVTPSAATLATGVYYTFSTASGEQQNPITNPQVFRVNPKVVQGAEPNDPRIAAKVDTSSAVALISIPVRNTVADTTVVDQVASRFGVRYPRAATDPLALMKTSELVLSRAQVLWALNRDADALALVNAVRQANGLPARTLASYGTRVDFLVNGILQEKRYELLFESPWRWVDFRSMGILNRIGTELPNAGGRLPFRAFPIPNNEAVARNGQIACQQ